jgi:hypothetical protein
MDTWLVLLTSPLEFHPMTDEGIERRSGHKLPVTYTLSFHIHSLLPFMSSFLQGWDTPALHGTGLSHTETEKFRMDD